MFKTLKPEKEHLTYLELYMPTKTNRDGTLERRRVRLNIHKKDEKFLRWYFYDYL